MKPAGQSILQLLRNRLAARARVRRANALYQQGLFAESAVLYQEALTLRPGQPVVHYNLGLALYKSGKKREGRGEWQKVLELTAGKKPYLHEQAAILLRQFS